MNKTIPQPLLHRCPGVMPELQRQFGLWICLWKSGTGSPVTYAETQPRCFEYYSLSYLIAGSSRFRDEADATERELVPGDLLLLQPHQIHRYGRTGTLFVEDALCFCGSAVEALREAGLLHAGVFRLPGLERPLQSIIATAANPAPQKQLEANIRLLQLLTELRPAPRPAARAARRHTDQRFQELLDRCAPDQPGFAAVEEMAQFYGCGADQFRILFRRHTGMLPKDYLDQCKITRARELLLTEEHSIAAIAAELGFHDQFHFSRVFKKKTGMPPSEFRRLFGTPAATEQE